MSRGFDDDLPRSVVAAGPLDSMFANTNVVILVIFSICCSCIAFVLSLIGLLTAKDPKAKSNAQLVVIVSGVVLVIQIALQFLGVLGNIIGGR